jgi:Domain of unknown function (DUF4124)
MRILLLLAGLAISLGAASQEIYRWVDKNGVVHYSDQPGASNAELINVIEPNAYDSADTAIASTPDAEDEAEPEESPYGSLAIVSPTPDEVFFGADAVVNAQADLQGALRDDDSVAFFLNGERQQSDGLSLQLSNLARGSYSLRASVLDPGGRPVISSQQVTFHVRQPSINSPQSPQAPKPPTRPPPRPTPTPRPPSR